MEYLATKMYDFVKIRFTFWLQEGRIQIYGDRRNTEAEGEMTAQKKDIMIEEMNPTFLFTWKGTRNKGDDQYHSHDFPELAFVLSGSGKYRIEGRLYSVGEGDVLILNPGVRHQALLDGESALPTTEFFVGFSDIQIKDMPRNYFPAPEGEYIIHTTGELRQKLFRICASMEAENAVCRQGRYFMLKSYLVQMLLLVIREQCTPVEAPGGYAFESVNKKYVDWEDLMFTNAPQHKHDISIRGGGEKMKFAASLAYLNQEGIVKGSGYERGNFRFNFDYSPWKWLDWGVNVSFSRSKKESEDSNFNQIITMSQLNQPYDENGELNYEVNMAGDINPLWRAKEYSKEQNDDYLTLATNLTLKPFKDFSYRLNVNLRANAREVGSYKTKKYPNSTGEGSISNFNRSSYQVENILNYTVPFRNKNHRLQLTLIQSVDQDLQKTTGLDFNNSTTDIFHWNVAADSQITGVTRSITRQRSLSFAARVQYNLLDRYLLTASVRRDGASVFGANNKWANFPSAALAWRLNDEAFLKDVTWIDMLKLRVSYGVVGNWAIPAYRTLGLADSYEYLFGDELAIGYLPSTQLLNKDLKWETTHSMNYGLDFSLFKGRINGTLEYYNTKTNDLIVQRTVPSISGYNTMWDNLGQTKSWGWEFSLSGSILRNQDFAWDAGFSISTQKNEIVKIDGRVDENGKPVNDLNNKWFIGESINVDYNYVFAGIWQEGETPQPNQYLEGDAVPQPGDIKLLDYNGDGAITPDDRKIYNLDPDWYGSIFTKFAYKGIDLGLDFYFVQGITKSNPYMYGYNEGGSLNGKKNGIKVNYWTPENASNEAPRPQYTAAVSYFGILGLQDASYFRLRSVTLGYTLPKTWTRKVSIEKARVYATATNLFTLTDYKSYSPEKNPGGYPEAQSFTFGLNLSF